MPDRPRVLLVDDDATVRHVIARALVQTFDIAHASDGAAAIELLQNGSFDAIVTDLEMPNVRGDEIVAWLETNQPEVAKRVVVMSGGAKRPEQAAWLRAFDSTRFVAKPCSVEALVKAIGVAMGARRE